MRNRTGLVTRSSFYLFQSSILRFALLSIISSLLVGCAFLGGSKPEPVPMGEVRFHIQEGDKHLNQGEYDKAVESYNAAINLHPESIDARRKLAEAYANHGDTDLALEEFARIIEINPGYSHAYNYRGFLYYNQEKWTEAAKEFEAAVDADPDSLYSINYLGLTYKMMNRLDDARNILQKAMELDPEMDDPDSKDTHNFLGLVYLDELKYEEAIAEFRKTLEHFPADATTHRYLGDALMNAERYREAAEEYSEALKLDPGDTLARSSLEALHQAGVAFPEVSPVEIVKDDPQQYIADAPDASEYPNAGAIILLDKLSYEFTDGGSARYTVHKIVKILNNIGIEEFGEMAMPFNSGYQTVGVNVAKTILPDGTEVEASSEAFHDITPPGLAEYNLYSDIMFRVVSMPALQPGAILEYEATVEEAHGTEMSWVLAGMAFQSLEPVLASKCVLRVPRDVEIKWKLYNCQIDPVIMEDNEGRLTYIWIYKDSPAFIPEAAMPPPEDLIPMLTFSTAESWEDVDKWYRELAEPQEQADKAIKRKVSELIAGKNSEEEKIKAIFEFVASEIRYVAIELGLGAYRPYPATDVFKNRYGDCKDKTTLLITMLREADIDAYPVLISPAPHKRVDTEIPSVGQFSHVIAAVQVEEGDYIWLDPTVATCRYGDLPAGDQGRKAFVIGKDGGEFVDTPIHTSEANKITSVSKITLMGDGAIRGWESTTTSGQADMYLRAVYRLIRPDSLKGFLESVFNQNYPGVQIENISISDLYDLDTPLEVKVDFSCPSYAADLEGTVVFPLPSEGFSAYATLVGPVERRYDLHLGYNMAVEKELTITLSEGYRLNSLPEDISIEHEFGRFVRRYEKIDGSTVRYFVSLKIDTPVIPASSYESLKKFLETAAREDRAQIILTKQLALGSAPAYAGGANTQVDH